MIRAPLKGLPSKLSDLWDSDDAAFKQQVVQLVQNKTFPYDFTALASFKAGHGHKADGTPVNLLEHTLDVICGNFGGFGLNTSITVQNLSQPQIRKILRIAALFHDSGKTLGRDGHIERSAEIAVRELYKDKERWNVSNEEILLIKHLILSNDLFGLYLRGSSRMSSQELQTALQNAYQSLQKDGKVDISENDFRKLLFTLWIADSSTLTVVNRRTAYLYEPLHQELDTLDYGSLDRLHALKSAIIHDPKDLPHFSKVSADVFRGAKPTQEGIIRLAELGIKTLISFNQEDFPIARQMDLDVISIPHDDFLEFLKKAMTSLKPIFIHGDEDSTSFMSAVYRLCD